MQQCHERHFQVLYWTLTDLVPEPTEICPIHRFFTPTASFILEWRIKMEHFVHSFIFQVYISNIPSGILFVLVVLVYYSEAVNSSGRCTEAVFKETVNLLVATKSVTKRSTEQTVSQPGWDESRVFMSQRNGVCYSFRKKTASSITAPSQQAGSEQTMH